MTGGVQKLPLVSYPEKERGDNGFIVILEKRRAHRKMRIFLYTKHIDCVEGWGRSTKEAKIDFLTKNADILVSVTFKNLNNNRDIAHVYPFEGRGHSGPFLFAIP
jgi:hypothetical protein